MGSVFLTKRADFFDDKVLDVNIVQLLVKTIKVLLLIYAHICRGLRSDNFVTSLNNYLINCSL